MVPGSSPGAKSCHDGDDDDDGGDGDDGDDDDDDGGDGDDGDDDDGEDEEEDQQIPRTRAAKKHFLFPGSPADLRGRRLGGGSSLGRVVGVVVGRSNQIAMIVLARQSDLSPEIVAFFGKVSTLERHCDWNRCGILH